MTWQPIETAPKDGTKFLAYWPDVHGNQSESVVTTWHEQYSYLLNAFHTPYDSEDWTNAPTHWMPLPEPPK